MAFTPQTLDGQKAAQKMLGWGKFAKHACLRAVHEAFPFSKSDAPGSYRIALDEWNRTPAGRRRAGDRNVPAGGIVLFDLTVTYSNGKRERAGHIGISLGGDRLVSTDWPSAGKVGVATISEIEKKWGAKYLGWKDTIGGHNVTVAVTGTPASVGGAQRTVRGDLPLGYAVERADAYTGAKETDRINAGVTGTFKGFVRGQRVNQNGVDSDVWLIGAHDGGAYWIGNFTDRSTAGLPDLGTHTVPGAAPAPAPAPKRPHVRIGENWRVYRTEHDAYHDIRANQVGVATPNTYLIVDHGNNGKPVAINVPGLGKVWIGGRRTAAPVVML